MYAPARAGRRASLGGTLFRSLLCVAAGLGVGYLLFRGGAHTPPPGPIPHDRGALVPQPKDVLNDTVNSVTFLQQNWGPEISVEFYNLRQGSKLVPYDWFFALEQFDNEKSFSDNDHIRRWRYLPQVKSPAFNPDGLPVGFVRDGSASSGEWFSMNCAACHTSQINYQGKGIRIDGGPTMGDFVGFTNAIIASLDTTLKDNTKLNGKTKFDRFAEAVLKGADTPVHRTALTAKMNEVLKTRQDFKQRNDNGNQPGQPIHPPYGFARLDALGAILNQVVSKGLDVPANAQTADAPVSYPFLWDTPQHKQVQWNGAVENTTLNIPGTKGIRIGALGRNVGQVLGVFGELDLTPKQFPPGYASSAEITNLIRAEDTLETLWSPLWPNDILPPYDTKLLAQGRAVYVEKCVECHKLMQRDDPKRKPDEQMISLDRVKTDDTMAMNFVRREAKTNKLKGVKQSFNPTDSQTFGEDAKAREILTHAVTGAIIHGMLSRPFGTLEAFAKSIFAADDAGGLKAYKARPLNGIWATAPYLHNGSVPTLAQLLKPAASREKKFFVGRLEFDPLEVGYVYKKEDYQGIDPKFLFEFDTSLPGNLNTGHEYGADLDDGKKKALLEFLKSL